MAFNVCLLTLNCWGIPYISQDRDIRMNAIADELNTGKYNVVTLQEIWTKADFELIRRKTAQVLPYAHYFHSGVVGSGICVLSLYRIVDTYFHQWSINGYIHRIQHGDWFGGKGVGLCKVETNDGTIINVYTAHLHAEYNRESDDYKAHRVLQAFETGKFIALTSSQADVTVLGADLNTEPTDLAYRVILGASGLRDTFIKDSVTTRSSGTNEHKENTYTSKNVAELQPEGKRIDYVLYKGSSKVRVKVTKYEHPLPETIPGHNVSYSDHEAVVATLQLNGNLLNALTEACPGDANSCMKQDQAKINDKTFSETYIQDLKESISICNEAMLSLDNHKRSYIMLSVTCFILLLGVIKMSSVSSLSITSGLTLATQMGLTIVWMFGLLMATLWNNIERNSIYAGKLAMEIHLDSL